MGSVSVTYFIAGAALLLNSAASAGAICDQPPAIHFARGATSAQLAGGIARGERDCFTIGARGGQRMTVTQMDSGEGNIVLQIYQPPWRIISTPDGPTINGKALDGAEEGRDASNWAGRLPMTGSYLLVLGTSRGGGNYSLRVDVR
jgi:hypothetical protein